jgi:lipoyl(octanoyl) transferase
VTQIIRLYDKPYDYQIVQQIMRTTHVEVVDNKIPNALIITRYNPIRTTGANGNLDTENPELHVIRDTRGGGETFHDPGQIVVYPICPLHILSAAWHMANPHIPFSYTALLQLWIENTILSFDFEISRKYPEVGVWIKNHEKHLKVGFIGGQVKNRVTLHGFAVNLNTDLAEFKKFAPCGMDEVEIGNLHIEMNEFIERIIMIGTNLLPDL